MIDYKLGVYRETTDGKVFDVLHSEKCECDTQAELTVTNLGDSYPDKIGLIIRRHDVEWFARF